MIIVIQDLSDCVVTVIQRHIVFHSMARGNLIAVSRIGVPNAVAQGTGGRMSQSGKTMAVFGATGFLGAYVVNQLGQRGHNIVVTTRGDDMSWRSLKQCADYGKIVPSYIHLNDEKTIRDTVRDCDVVINLMGKHHDTKHYLPSIINCSLADVHIAGAEKVARISREENVKHLVHVSAAAVGKNASSRWSKTKAEGEQMVKKEFPGAVIVRPNVMYGEEDRFLTMYAPLIKVAPKVPLVEEGKGVMNPVYVGDVGKAIATIAENYATCDSVFNLSGKHQYSVKEIFEYIMDTIHIRKDFVDVPVGTAKLIGKLVDKLPNPYITEDNVQLLRQNWDTQVSGEQSWDELNITPASFESKAFSFLYRYRIGGHFAEENAGHSSMYRYGAKSTPSQ